MCIIPDQASNLTHPWLMCLVYLVGVVKDLVKYNINEWIELVSTLLLGFDFNDMPAASTFNKIN